MFTKVACVLVVICSTHFFAGRHVNAQSESRQDVFPPGDFPPQPFPTSTPGDFVPGGFPIAGGPIPGGISGDQTIDPLHEDMAAFAAGDIGSEYTLNRVLSVQSQVVQGMLYHMKISVTKVSNNIQTVRICDVKVQYTPWVGHLQDKKLTEFHCRADDVF